MQQEIARHHVRGPSRPRRDTGAFGVLEGDDSMVPQHSGAPSQPSLPSVPERPTQRRARKNTGSFGVLNGGGSFIQQQQQQQQQQQEEEASLSTVAESTAGYARPRQATGAGGALMGASLPPHM
eukprot:COSAG05_NODE_702_length_7857_cov_37.135244_4_plen_124_part_00